MVTIIIRRTPAYNSLLVLENFQFVPLLRFALSPLFPQAHAIATMVVRLMTSQGQSIKGVTDRELPGIKPLFGEKNKAMHDYYLTTYQYIK